MPDLSVKYYYPGIDSELDKHIETVLESAGYKLYASGYDLIENRRDLAFDFMGNNA